MLVPWYLVAFEIIGKSGSVCNHSVFKAILVHQDGHKACWSWSAVWLDGVSLSITSSLIDKLNVVVSAGRWTLHLCRNITRLQAAESSPLMLLRVNKVSGSLPPCDLWLKLVALAMRMERSASIRRCKNLQSICDTKNITDFLRCPESASSPHSSVGWLVWVQWRVTQLLQSFDL